jgi:hypothetical protein
MLGSKVAHYEIAERFGAGGRARHYRQSGCDIVEMPLETVSR